MPAPGPNPYEVLKVTRNASVEEIEDAYDASLTGTRPRAQAGDQDAIEKLNTLNDARDVLVDPRQPCGAGQSIVPAPGDRGSGPCALVVAEPAKTSLGQSPKLRRQRPQAGTRELGTQSPSGPGGARGIVKPDHNAPLHRFYHYFIIIAFLLFAIAVAITYLLNGEPMVTTAGIAAGIVATVNTQPIYQDDYKDQVNKDKTNALNDPLFGTLFNNFQGITGTRALKELRFDSLDKVINMQVIVQEAKKEGNLPHRAHDRHDGHAGPAGRSASWPNVHQLLAAAQPHRRPLSPRRY